MNRISTLGALVFALIALTVSGASAQSLLAACGKDITTYCSKVTPGEGRIAACLYAHGDKIADQCVSAIETTALQIENAIDHIQYGYEQCAEDIDKFCAKVEPGGGRMYDCIKRNGKSLTPACTKAVEGLEARFIGARRQE